MKWTSDNDQLLLLKILETHDITVKANAISAAWPLIDSCPLLSPAKKPSLTFNPLVAKDREVPTPRAITERLVSIRKQAIKNGAGHFTVSSSQTKGPPRSAPTTPRKPRAPKAATNGNGTPSSAGKRKRPATKVKTEAADADGEGDDDDDDVGGGGVKLNDSDSGNDNGLANGNDVDGINNGTNGEDNGEGGLELESPTKKLRVSSQVKTEKYTEAGDDEEGEEDSEVSEYADAV
ncbi:MAG: hypothetical protein M1836_003046 [Candelina mexicana]|nr:MAG: hypothetical protein M1836_003046 [Candelina mexicana]